MALMIKELYTVLNFNWDFEIQRVDIALLV